MQAELVDGIEWRTSSAVRYLQSAGEASSTARFFGRVGQKFQVHAVRLGVLQVAGAMAAH
jgi:hypothetical protein